MRERFYVSGYDSYGGGGMLDRIRTWCVKDRTIGLNDPPARRPYREPEANNVVFGPATEAEAQAEADRLNAKERERTK